MAGGAQLGALYFDFLLAPEGGFFKRYSCFILQVGAALRRMAGGVRHATEEGLKDIAEAAEVKALKAACEEAVRVNVSEVVITSALVGVGKYLEGLAYFLELRLCPVIAVAVGVILKGQPAERLFNILRGGAPRYAQDFVIISFRCHILQCLPCAISLL